MEVVLIKNIRSFLFDKNKGLLTQILPRSMASKQQFPNCFCITETCFQMYSTSEREVLFSWPAAINQIKVYALNIFRW